MKASNNINKLENAIKNIIQEHFDPMNIDAVLDSYLETALWAEEEDGEEKIEKPGLGRGKKPVPTLRGKTIFDVDDVSRDKARKDIENFIDTAKKEAPEELGTYTSESLGHNIWLSRNGHGAGFFDDNNDKLQDIARKMGSQVIYAGDDDAVYIME